MGDPEGKMFHFTQETSLKAGQDTGPVAAVSGRGDALGPPRGCPGSGGPAARRMEALSGVTLSGLPQPRQGVCVPFPFSFTDI